MGCMSHSGLKLDLSLHGQAFAIEKLPERFTWRLGAFFLRLFWQKAVLRYPAIALPPGRRRFTQRPDGSQLAVEIVRRRESKTPPHYPFGLL